MSNFRILQSLKFFNFLEGEAIEGFLEFLESRNCRHIKNFKHLKSSTGGRKLTNSVNTLKFPQIVEAPSASTSALAAAKVGARGGAGGDVYAFFFLRRRKRRLGKALWRECR